jgi:methionyl-tRNA synthetase
MPAKMARLLGRLGEPVENFRLADAAAWGRLRSGARLEAGEPLFPRIDEAELARTLPELWGGAVPTPKPAAPLPPAPENVVELIEIQDFAKIQLRVAKVVTAEKLANTDKLLKLQVDIGGVTRQIVAGIAQFYTPEDMVGRLVVVVANLKPAKLRGELSEGMLLAAKTDGKLVLITVDGDVRSGASIS